MGTIMLIALLAIEAFFFLWTITSKSNHGVEKSIVRMAALALLAVLLLTGVLEWGFRYYLILAVLIVQAIIGAIVLARKTEKPYRLGSSVRRIIGCVLLYAFALSIAIVFPQHRQLTVTGPYEVATAKYTWTDESRMEPFANTGEKRAVTVDLWYPQRVEGKCPVVLFSHGLYGIGTSNETMYKELASHGYVVGSISHTYLSMYTEDASGKTIIADLGFMQSSSAQLYGTDDPEKIFEAFGALQETRIADVHFILDTVITEANGGADPLLRLIDTGKIGLSGHSMGGTTATIIGRERNDIAAVVNLDAPLYGELLGYHGGKMQQREEEYPVPLLTIYSDDLWGRMEEDGLYSANVRYLSDTPKDIYNVHIKGAKHLSFTDLPLFSPLMANALQGGNAEVDKYDCIETMNGLVLQFFNGYLKGGPIPHFEKEYE